MSSIYFGGSRHFNPTDQSVSIVRAVVLSGAVIHVGCQSGADQSVLSYVGFFAPSQLKAFAVATCKAEAPRHIQQAPQSQITYSAGGNTSIPINARYLLRSIAAFKGCESAVFFSPGAGSLAVARECVRSGLSVHAFGNQPAPIPSCKGAWFTPSWFSGFQCWSWGSYKEPEQYSFFS